jgi:hypothetical protein
MRPKQLDRYDGAKGAEQEHELPVRHGRPSRQIGNELFQWIEKANAEQPAQRYEPRFRLLFRLAIEPHDRDNDPRRKLHENDKQSLQPCLAN